MTSEQLDELLTVLRRHKVSHYTEQGPGGCVSVALEPVPASVPEFHDPGRDEITAKTNNADSLFGPRGVR